MKSMTEHWKKQHRLLFQTRKTREHPNLYLESLQLSFPVSFAFIPHKMLFVEADIRKGSQPLTLPRGPGARGLIDSPETHNRSKQ